MADQLSEVCNNHIINFSLIYRTLFGKIVTISPESHNHQFKRGNKSQLFLKTQVNHALQSNKTHS